MAAVLALASLLVNSAIHGSRWQPAPIFLFLLFVALMYDKKMAAAGFVDVDTPYNRVVVLNGTEKIPAGSCVS